MYWRVRLLIDAFRVIIPPLYDVAYPFHDGLAAVRLMNKWGYIDPKGVLVIEHQYLYASNFSEGLASVALKESQYGYIDRQGQQVIALQFHSAGDFSEGLADVGLCAIDETWKYGFINRSGQVVIPYQFNWTNGGFSEGLAAVKIEQEVWIDKRGQIIKQDE